MPEETILDLSREKQRVIGSLEIDAACDGYIGKRYEENLSKIRQINRVQEGRLEAFFKPIKDLFIRGVYDRKRIPYLVLAIRRLEERGELPIRNRELLRELDEKFTAYNEDPSEDTFKELANTYNEVFLDEELNLKPLEVAVLRIRASCRLIQQILSDMTDPRLILAKNKEEADLENRFKGEEDKQAQLMISRAKQKVAEMRNENRARCMTLKRVSAEEVSAARILDELKDSISGIMQKDQKIKQTVERMIERIARGKAKEKTMKRMEIL
ncbi:hypothetical protein J4442_02475 [Candidatus Woesearchaeota archaeon]|nr:hypothetical protein [Candidatus Woesearchaeota archaeon]